ncbi:hypothetical protein ZWY2020_019162 [Hordeum vulgare]|nr:hypothetical protein ZWY2020_019162 [Hordeum vulgare]
MARCWLLLLLCAFLWPAVSATPCHHHDLHALRGFAEELGGGGALLRTAWSGASCCDWEGVGCDGATGRVTALRLPGHGLAGPIPGASLAGLVWLEELFLGSNSFVGVLPDELFGLARLRKLSLASNELTGELSPRLGELTRLTSLDLSDNRFSGRLPDVFDDLTSLEHLAAHSNDFSGFLPPSLASLSSLRELNLRNNSMSGPIARVSFSGMPFLSSVDFSTNHLTGWLPTSLAACGELRSLNLANNTLVGNIPSWMGEFDRLWYLDLSNNSFVGEVPRSLIRLMDLTTVGTSPAADSMAKCWLLLLCLAFLLPAACATCHPDDLRALRGLARNLRGGGAVHLRTVWSGASCCDWEGVGCHGANGRVTVLRLPGHGLAGSIPGASLAGLARLEELFLSSNSFAGTLPDALFGLVGLRKLSLASNNLVGQLSSRLSDLKNLTLLDLSINRFSGQLPDNVFHNLKSMEHLAAHSNGFSGLLPPSLSSLSSLRELNLCNNSLSGPIARVNFSGMPLLSSVDFTSNYLSGSLPLSLADCGDLKSLSLANNRLVGTIPSWIGELDHLRLLDLSNNSLVGKQLDEEEDRLSTLTDDILLTILGRVTSLVATRISVLSTRWRHLPWLLPELSIDVQDFLSAPCADPIEENDMEQAMASLTKATRSFLNKQQREFTISSLHLNLYLINTFLCEVGHLIGDAIDSGLLKDLDLSVLDETEPLDRSEEEMQQRAQEIDSFFSAYPSVLHCLTKLSLKNVGFDKLDMHHVLFECCKQLNHLSLFHCDTGSFSLFKIDAPDSKLRVLEIGKCRFVRIDLVCLPKLEKFLCETWLWLQPEMEELCTAFRKLRKLFVRGIFVEFDILWTTTFLVAAPSIEMLHIEVWEHVCDVGEARPASYLTRSTPRRERHLDSSSENKLLKELEFAGFKSLEHQFTFIRSMLERCPNLHKIVLRGDEHCSSCDALKASRPLKFPNRKQEQEMVVKRIRDGMFLPEIFFYE